MPRSEPYTNGLLAALRGNEVVFGTAIHITDPSVTEMCGIAGYTWVSVILEHAPISSEQVEAIIRAADSRGLTVLVHAPEGDHRLLPALNARVGGVVSPHVATAEEAAAFVLAHRYPPLGDRSAHGTVRATDYGANQSVASLADLDHGVVVGISIEDEEGVANADEIFAVPGLTLSFIGLLDLSKSLGVTGDFHHVRVQRAIERVVAAAAARGIFIAMPAYGYSIAELYGLGARMILSPTGDYAAIMKTLGASLRTAREELAAALEGAAPE